MSEEKPVDMDRETEIIGEADDSDDEADDSAEKRETGAKRQDHISNGSPSAALLLSNKQMTGTDKKSDANKGCTLQLFLANMSVLCLLYICQLTYGSGVIRTMERRFGLRSAQTGLMQSSNDITHVCLVVFIGYFGRKAHKPRIICVTVLFSGVAAFLMASPHFFMSNTAYDATKYKPVNSTNVNSSLLSKQFCVNWNASGAAVSGDQCDQLEQGSLQTEVHPAYYVFVFAQLINGIGGSGLHTLSLAYIDENAPGTKSSFYIGIFSSMMAFGPMSGMILSALTLRLPEDLLSPVEGNPSDPSWIGCWWLGYFICAIGIFATAIPLWFFPKSCSEKATIANEKEKTKLAEASKATDDKTLSVARREILEFPRRLLHLFRNKPYVVNLFSVVCGGYVIIGIFVNLVRYIEIHFLERAFVASLIAALVTAFAGAIGGFLGGLLMSRLKIRPPGAVKIVIFSSIVCSTGLVIVLFLQCPQLEMAGRIDPENNRFTVITDCNQHCACSTSRKSYHPVCGSDNLTYFSACAAGCKSFLNGTYYDCGCPAGGKGGGAEAAEGGGVGEGGWARPGFCLSRCNLIIPFAITFFVTSLLGSMARVPSMIVNFRIVDDDERSFALSINSFAINLLAFIPAPLLFGFLIDSACILWQTTCKKTGGCLLFNTDRFRHLTYGTALVFTAVDLMLNIILFLFVRKMVFRAPDADLKQVAVDAGEEKRKEKLSDVETSM